MAREVTMVVVVVVVVQATDVDIFILHRSTGKFVHTQGFHFHGSMFTIFLLL